MSAALAVVENTTPENPVAVKLKQWSAQAAMHALSSAVFCVLSLGAVWWCSQSGIACDADTAIGAAPAKPSDAGSVATDRPTSMAKMVRPMRRVIWYFARASKHKPGTYIAYIVPNSTFML
ncbi:MAG TPA: hypothetical protein VIJ17_03850 [Pseudolabrys sp.]